jgi:signal transduction histidine kinase
VQDAYARDIEAVNRIDVVPMILDAVCRITGMGFAAIARVSDDRWVACSVRDDINFGLVPGGELKLETTICNEIRVTGAPVIISDVETDAVFRDHITPALYGFRSYISMPIRLPDGRFFGTLCAIDPSPRDLSRPEVRGVFQGFADLMGFHLNAADQLTVSEANLAVEREAGELREQFIAVVGHDLRNPLASVQAGVNLLRRKPPEERALLILDQMQNSIDRMAALIGNILDFARGRLGGGISLYLKQVDIGPVMNQVIDELASTHPNRVIDAACFVDVSVECDPDRIGQLLSNLIGNAITHGSPDQPIAVRCEATEDDLVISVANGGDEIPLAARAQLFHPFSRGKVGGNREGLGLGLYIASKIAAAHGGQITVASSPVETRFTFRMPLANA